MIHYSFCFICTPSHHARRLCPSRSWCSHAVFAAGPGLRDLRMQRESGARKTLLQSSTVRARGFPAAPAWRPVMPTGHDNFSRSLASLGSALFDKLLACRNRHGLLAKHIDIRSGEQWGNFVQTYSMVGLINAAIRLSIRWDEAF